MHWYGDATQVDSTLDWTDQIVPLAHLPFHKVMLDNHDLQRGHTGKLGFNVNHFEPKLYKVGTALMLAWPYGTTRVMSSYYWNQEIKVRGGGGVSPSFGR